MVNLIGFAGRMRSGKGELSAICERYGYQRLTFAYPLKSLCAELLGITLEEEDKLKGYYELIAKEEGMNPSDYIEAEENDDDELDEDR